MTPQQQAEAPLWKDGNKGGGVQFVNSFKRLEKEDIDTYAHITQREGWEGDFGGYHYRVGAGKFGLWLMRKPNEPAAAVNNGGTADLGMLAGLLERIAMGVEAIIKQNSDFLENSNPDGTRKNEPRFVNPASGEVIVSQGGDDEADRFSED
jgi:hypothetical protein